jgi:hypothetical protein
MPKKPELKLSRCIDDSFAVPDAEAELVGKSSLELADASVSMIYKVCVFFIYCTNLVRVLVVVCNFFVCECFVVLL